MTPDNYWQNILKLILTLAETSSYMQTAVHHVPNDKDGNQNFMAGFKRWPAKSRTSLDVRIILSQYETLAKLGFLQDAGVDISAVRIQANVHNKLK